MLSKNIKIIISNVQTKFKYNYLIILILKCQTAAFVR